jgi:hypothetical protein
MAPPDPSAWQNAANGRANRHPLSTHPGGMQGCSRWLSEATPPEPISPPHDTHPGRGARPRRKRSRQDAKTRSRPQNQKAKPSEPRQPPPRPTGPQQPHPRGLRALRASVRDVPNIVAAPSRRCAKPPLCRPRALTRRWRCLVPGAPGQGTRPTASFYHLPPSGDAHRTRAPHASRRDARL